MEENLLQEIYSEIKNQQVNEDNITFKQLIQNALIKSFSNTNEEYKKLASSTWTDWDSGGSTAVVGVIYKEIDNTFHLSVANTGDSRSIYCCENENLNVYPMSFDHKPNTNSEKARIEASGGFIAKAARGPWRVNGILATSRSFGDFGLYPQVIVDPEIIDIEIGRFVAKKGLQLNPQWSSKGSILIIASDGFWDVFENQEAASAAQKWREEGKLAEEMSKLFVELSYERYSGDNITVLVVFIDHLLSSLYKK